MSDGNGSKAVLITGCSTGIGRETARHLAGLGPYTVYATARKVETLADLEAARCRTLALDVCDEDSMSAAVAAVEEAEGAVWALVNNAGYSQSGAVESIPLESVRRQFETNVFGLLRMCQLVLPKMRERRDGRIVNIGSMGGKLTFPGGGIYHATKYSLEAISDAMRWELAGFGVDVVLIEPGLITTSFGETAHSSVEETEDGPYSEFNRQVAQTTAEAYEGPMAKLGGSLEKYSAAIRAQSAPARRSARVMKTSPSCRRMSSEAAGTVCRFMFA